LIWDIGFFSLPNTQFIELNAFSNANIDLASYLAEYQLFLTFLKNSKSIDLRSILGFNSKERIELDGDVFVTKDRIYHSLDKYGFEIQNVDYLMNSALVQENLYSFLELERKFSHLVPPFNFVKDDKTAKMIINENEEDEYVESFD